MTQRLRVLGTLATGHGWRLRSPKWRIKPASRKRGLEALGDGPAVRDVHLADAQVDEIETIRAQIWRC